MMNTRFKSEVATLICVVLVASICPAQVSYVNDFRLEEDGSYSWKPDANTAAISPGGSFRSNNVKAEFPNFNAFANDVIGQWTVYRSNGAMVTFELLPFSSDSFSQLDLVFPVHSQTILSGSIVESMVDSSLNLESTSQGFSNIGGVDVDFLGGFNFRLTLNPGFDKWEVEYFVCGAVFEDALVTNIQGDTGSIQVDSEVTFSTNHPFITLVVANQLGPGDVNQDGVTDLLDVAPFVLLLSGNEFQAEADINQDGVVDLLDVSPFVGLLTGG